MSAQPKAVMPRPYSGYTLRAVPPEDPEVTHTDAGTPMGELMRRFWQPVCLASRPIPASPTILRAVKITPASRRRLNAGRACTRPRRR